MRTVETLAFWRQFEACVNGAFEVQSRLRRECCGGVGRAVGLSFNEWEKLNEKNTVEGPTVMQDRLSIRLIYDIYLCAHRRKNSAKC